MWVSSHCWVVTEVPVRHIVVSEFKIELYYYIHIQTNAPWERYEPPYSASKSLNSAITVEWIWL